MPLTDIYAKKCDEAFGELRESFLSGKTQSYVAHLLLFGPS